MRTFYKLLGVALLVVTTNNFVWFALTFWAYLTTRSVISTSTLAGVYLVMTMVSGLWFGSLVDHHQKKHAMLGSSVVTLLLFAGGLVLLEVTPVRKVPESQRAETSRRSGGPLRPSPISGGSLPSCAMVWSESCIQYGGFSPGGATCRHSRHQTFARHEE